MDDHGPLNHIQNEGCWNCPFLEWFLKGLNVDKKMFFLQIYKLTRCVLKTYWLLFLFCTCFLHNYKKKKIEVAEIYAKNIIFLQIVDVIFCPNFGRKKKRMDNFKTLHSEHGLRSSSPMWVCHEMNFLFFTKYWVDSFNNEKKHLTNLLVVKKINKFEVTWFWRQKRFPWFFKEKKSNVGQGP